MVARVHDPRCFSFKGNSLPFSTRVHPRPILQLLLLLLLYIACVSGWVGGWMNVKPTSAVGNRNIDPWPYAVMILVVSVDSSLCASGVFNGPLPKCNSSQREPTLTANKSHKRISRRRWRRRRKKTVGMTHSRTENHMGERRGKVFWRYPSNNIIMRRPLAAPSRWIIKTTTTTLACVEAVVA